MLEIIKDTKEEAKVVKRAISVLNVMVSEEQGIFPEAVLSLISLLDSDKEILIAESLGVLSKMIRFNHWHPDENLWVKMLERTVQVIPVMEDYRAAIFFLESGYTNQMVQLGMIEKLVERLERHPDTTVYNSVELWKIIFQSPEEYSRAITAGFIPNCIRSLNEQITNGSKQINIDEHGPRVLGLLCEFLKNPTSHKEFVDLGGIKPLLSVLASYKKKQPEIFETLINIGSNSASLLEVLSADPALSAQMAIALKGNSTSKDHCIHLASLFIRAGIQVHPALISECIPALISSLSHVGSKLSHLEALQALNHIAEWNQEYAKLIGVQGGMQAVKEIMKTATGDVRRDAIYLMLQIPETLKNISSQITNFKSLPAIAKEQVLLHLSRDPTEITSEMVAFLFSQIEKGNINERNLKVLCVLAAQATVENTVLKFFSQFEAVTNHLKKGHKASMIEIELILVLGILIISPGNFKKVLTLCKEIEGYIDVMTDQIVHLLNFVPFAGKNFIITIIQCLTDIFLESFYPSIRPSISGYPLKQAYQ